MGEIEKLLRYQSPGEYEFKISAQTISGEVTPGSDVQCAGQLFTSALTGGQGRRGLFVYNNSDPASGEAFWGPEGVLPTTGFPIPKGALVEIPMIDDFDVYVATGSGELADIRFLEIA